MKTHSEIMDSKTKLTSCPIMPTYGAPSVMFVRGKGTELWDNSGERYLDFVGGLAVQSLGHANEEIAEVLASQASKLTQVSNYWATEHAHHVAIAAPLASRGAETSVSTKDDTQPLQIVAFEGHVLKPS